MKRFQRASRSAFTIVELLVVVVLIAILTVLAVTQFLKSSEVSRAGRAIDSMNQILAAQHMYTLSKPGQAPTVVGPISNTCNANTACGAGGACDLVNCSFLAKRDWDSSDYNLYVLNPNNTAADAGICGFGMPAGAVAPVGCAARRVCGVGGVTTNCAQASSPYASWGYVVDSTGALFSVGGAVAEEGAAPSSPPPPPH